MMTNHRSTSLGSHESGPPVRELGWALLVVSIGLLGLAALDPWDLAISSRLSDPNDPIGPIVQIWGGRPSWLAIGLAGVVLLSRRLRTVHPLAARASSALIAQALIHPGLITNAIKLLSGRPRPVHVHGISYEFRNFYEFVPGMGDFSFPSGHVAFSMLLAPVALLLWRHGSRPWASVVALGTCLWVGFIAWGRVIYLAHFPTDVAFSMVLGVATAPLALWIGDRFCRYLERRGSALLEPARPLATGAGASGSPPPPP